MTLHCVTANGWTTGYGAEIYLIGAYRNKEAALKAAYDAPNDCTVTITEIDLDETYALNEEAYGGYGNDKYLGGYCE